MRRSNTTFDDREEVLQKLRDRLLGSEYATPRTKCNDQHVSHLICPVCGDKSAWAYTAAPYSINCNRLNNCAATTRTLQLFPDLLLKVERDFPRTQNDPHAPARAFLKLRGLGESLVGVQFEYWGETRHGCGGAVMFPLGINPEGKKVYNGRIFDPPPGEGKTHNNARLHGLFWKHPARSYEPSRETFVVEGIIDALSLIELGHQAVAVLSSVRNPKDVDLKPFDKLVFAFDNDEAGIKALRGWIDHYSQRVSSEEAL